MYEKWLTESGYRTYGDVVREFVEDWRTGRKHFSLGEQQFWYVGWQPGESKRGKVLTLLSFESRCCVCGAKFRFAKTPSYLERHPRVPRSCRECVSPRLPAGAWLEGAKLKARRGRVKYNVAKASRKAILKTKPWLKRKPRGLGSTERLVLEQLDRWSLVGEVKVRVIVRETAALMSGSCARRSVRFALASLERKGLSPVRIVRD